MIENKPSSTKHSSSKFSPTPPPPTAGLTSELQLSSQILPRIQSQHIKTSVRVQAVFQEINQSASDLLRAREKAKDKSQLIHLLEALLITLEATQSLLDPLWKYEDTWVGHNVLTEAVGSVPCNGFETLLFILLSLIKKTSKAVKEIEKCSKSWTSGFQINGYIEKLQAYHDLLRAYYSILHLAVLVTKKVDVTETLFANVADYPELEPKKWHSVVRVEEFFGRKFGFHYTADMRNLLRLVNISRASVEKAHSKTKNTSANNNIAVLGWGWVYSNMTILHNLGINIEGAKSIGLNKHDEELTIGQVRTFFNLVEDPIYSGVSVLTSTDVAVDKKFSIPPCIITYSKGPTPEVLTEPIKIRVLAVMHRPVRLVKQDNNTRQPPLKQENLKSKSNDRLNASQQQDTFKTFEFHFESESNLDGDHEKQGDCGSFKIPIAIDATRNEPLSPPDSRPNLTNPSLSDDDGAFEINQNSKTFLHSQELRTEQDMEDFARLQTESTTKQQQQEQQPQASLSSDPDFDSSASEAEQTEPSTPSVVQTETQASPVEKTKGSGLEQAVRNVQNEIGSFFSGDPDLDSLASETEQNEPSIPSAVQTETRASLVEKTKEKPGLEQAVQNVQNEIGSFFVNMTAKIDTILRPGGNQLAKGLIMHFHGGGFIAQSSSSHSIYLREWAADIPDCVIVSVDYKLAPEYKYPVALNEITSAYMWVLEHRKQLGTLAEKIVLTGDSAGGNFAVALSLRLQRYNVQQPDGIVLAYPALYVTPAVSPSRLLAFFDPLLPLSILNFCVDAYLPKEMDGDVDPFVSPSIASNEMLSKLPPLSIICGALDPLLDDSIYFVQRLKNLGRKDIRMKILPSMPHGFLNMVQVSKEAVKAMHHTASWMAQYLETSLKLR